MNKKEILELDNESLIGRLLDLEIISVKEENSKRGLTKNTIKEYKWTFEEVCKRFNLDLKKLMETTGVRHLWKEDEL